MKFESALSKLRDLDVMQDVLATVQIIELNATGAHDDDGAVKVG